MYPPARERVKPAGASEASRRRCDARDDKIAYFLATSLLPPPHDSSSFEPRSMGMCLLPFLLLFFIFSNVYNPTDVDVVDSPASAGGKEDGDKRVERWSREMRACVRAAFRPAQVASVVLLSELLNALSNLSPIGLPHITLGFYIMRLTRGNF